MNKHLEALESQYEWGKSNLDNPSDNLHVEDIDYLFEEAKKVDVLKNELLKIKVAYDDRLLDINMLNDNLVKCKKALDNIIYQHNIMRDAGPQVQSDVMLAVARKVREE